MSVTFLLGPAGSGKTWRCLAEIRAALAAPGDAPLLLLAPRQATFQLERQLLADGSLPGYTRLQILSFDRLADFLVTELAVAPPNLLGEEGRLMVLRALLLQQQAQLKIFRSTARLPGFAQQLSRLLREFQRNQVSPQTLADLSLRTGLAPELKAKLADLALMLGAYRDWLQARQLQDADSLLDVATAALSSAIGTRPSPIRLAGLWLDGFAEMTPQELDLLAALLPFCDRATLAFCLDHAPVEDAAWISTWSVVSQTFRRCYQKIARVTDDEPVVEVMKREPGRGRFAGNSSLAHLERSWISPNSQLPTPSSQVRLCLCADPEAEAVLAAREVLRHVHAGGRFRDVAVLVRSLAGYDHVLRRVFARYDIPFFLDRREPVAHHPLAELTRSALRLAAFGWEHDDWFSALKSGLVSDDEGTIDRLENEALKRGWKGGAWFEPLAIPDDLMLEQSVARWLVPILPSFRQWLATLSQLQRRPTGAELAAAFRALWSDMKVEQRLEDWSAAKAREFANRKSQIANPPHRTVWEQMQSWLDNLELAFPDEALPLVEWLPILEAGLANLSVGVIPPALDEVLIGAIDRSRNPELQLVVLPGWNEGVFPAPPPRAPLLTEADRAALAAHDVPLGPGLLRQIGHERYLGYIACTRASQRVVVTSAARNAGGQPLNPSPFLAHLRRSFPGLEVETDAPHSGWRVAEHPGELVTPVLLSVVGDDALSASQVERGAAEVDAVIPANALAVLETLPVFAPVLVKWRQLTAARAESNLPPALAGQLYRAELRTSVSALEKFAACPFKFFAAHGLRAEERIEFEVDRRDRGSFQHEILQEFHREVRAAGKQWRDYSPADARALVGRIGEDLLPRYRDGLFAANDVSRFTARVLIAGAQQLIQSLIEWMPQYGFDPHAVELSFGFDADGLPGWRLELDASHAMLLRGRIDRVDLRRDPGGDGALGVVIDYKSSLRKLDPVKLHYGLELQLLSYLGVLRNLTEPQRVFGVTKLFPAGVFYVSLKPAYGSAPTRHEAFADGGAKRRSGYQHAGRFNAEFRSFFDNRGESKGDQFKYSIKKDGELSKTGNDALTPVAFAQLLGDVEEHLRRIGRAIYGGDVGVSPFRKGGETACEYCDFRPVCRFDPWTDLYRVLRLPPKPAS